MRPEVGTQRGKTSHMDFKSFRQRVRLGFVRRVVSDGREVCGWRAVLEPALGRAPIVRCGTKGCPRRDLQTPLSRVRKTPVRKNSDSSKDRVRGRRLRARRKRPGLRAACAKGSRSWEIPKKNSPNSSNLRCTQRRILFSRAKRLGPQGPTKRMTGKKKAAGRRARAGSRIGVTG